MSLNWSQTLRTAEMHISRGRITAAIEEYRKLVAWDPSDLTTLNTLGDLCVRAGLYEEAKQIFSRAAQAYRSQGYTSKAIALHKKILRIDPAAIASAASLAECYLAQGLRGEARRQYADVADAHRRAGREDKALEALQRVAEIDPSNTSLLMMLGDRWLREGLRRQAHASFMSAADRYSSQGDDDRALTAYLKARDVQPDEHKTLAAIASICASRGEADNAITILSESLARNSSDAELHRLLGSTYLSAGRLDDAERTFQKLLALDGAEYRNLLILGKKFLERGDIDRAVEQVDRIVDRLIANRNEQQAVDFLRDVLDCDPEHPASLRMLALIFRRVHEDFKLALTLRSLAAGALRRGDRDQAIEALKELCIIEPYERAHRDSLKNLGVEASDISFAVSSAANNPQAYAAADPSRSGYSGDSIGLLESAQKDEPDKLEAILALKQRYANDGLFDMSARINPLSHAAPAEFDFVLDDAPPEATPPSVHAVSPLANQRATGCDLSTASNRRRTRRIAARVPLVVTSDTGGWCEFTETVDVGETGLKLQLAHTTPPMTALRVSLAITKWPNGLKRMSAISAAKGTVRYCKQRLGLPNLVGVELRPMLEQLDASEAFIDESGESV